MLPRFGNFQWPATDKRVLALLSAKGKLRNWFSPHMAGRKVTGKIREQFPTPPTTNEIQTKQAQQTPPEERRRSRYNWLMPLLGVGAGALAAKGLHSYFGRPQAAPEQASTPPPDVAVPFEPQMAPPGAVPNPVGTALSLFDPRTYGWGVKQMLRPVDYGATSPETDLAVHGTALDNVMLRSQGAQALLPLAMRSVRSDIAAPVKPLANLFGAVKQEGAAGLKQAPKLLGQSGGTLLSSVGRIANRWGPIGMVISDLSPTITGTLRGDPVGGVKAQVAGWKGVNDSLYGVASRDAAGQLTSVGTKLQYGQPLSISDRAQLFARLYHGRDTAGESWLTKAFPNPFGWMGGVVGDNSITGMSGDMNRLNAGLRENAAAAASRIAAKINWSADDLQRAQQVSDFLYRKGSGGPAQPTSGVDLVRFFRDGTANRIMDARQSLIDAGTPRDVADSEIRRLIGVSAPEISRLRGEVARRLGSSAMAGYNWNR